MKTSEDLKKNRLKRCEKTTREGEKYGNVERN